jgi:hypothetical protein
MTEQGRWPSATDYIDAVQYPALVFSHDELKEARFDLDMYGIPDGCTGSNAIVFRAMLGPRTVALRCFTSQAGLSRERYLALARHVDTDERGRRWMVPAAWRDEALRVKSEQWPLVEMEWVNGRPLDVYVGALCQTQPTALPLLADRWRDMLGDLSTAQVAHGDLQHGNVLVDQSSTALRLVDLDGAWVPGMQGLAPPTESGHQAFRHPNRPTTDQWGPFMDTFPGLVVLVSLLALAQRPDLWATYNNGDNLIFTAGDFAAVDATALWADLTRIDDRELADLLLLLKQCCDPEWQPDASLTELIAEGGPVARRATAATAEAIDEETAEVVDEAPTATIDAPAPPPVATAGPAAETAALLEDGLDWEVNEPAAHRPTVRPPARTVADPTMEFAVVSNQRSGRSAPPATPPPPTATTVLPPPPEVEAATMHAPVENPVLAGEPDAAGPSNPFAVPAMARASTSAGPTGPPPPASGTGRTSMATGYIAWTLLALVFGLVVLGIPALLLARRASTEKEAGDTARAIKHSYAARTAAIVAVIVGAVVLYLVIAAVISDRA